MAEHRPASSESLQPHTERSSRSGSEKPPSVEADIVYVWRYALLVVHDREEEEEEININITRMWANTQRDGRPAEYRWRPLFNAAKWLTDFGSIQFV